MSAHRGSKAGALSQVPVDCTFMRGCVQAGCRPPDTRVGRASSVTPMGERTLDACERAFDSGQAMFERVTTRLLQVIGNLSDEL